MKGGPDLGGIRLGAWEAGTVLFGEERCALVPIAAASEQLSKLTDRRQAAWTPQRGAAAIAGRRCLSGGQTAITSAASDANASGATTPAGSLASPRQLLRSRRRWRVSPKRRKRRTARPQPLSTAAKPIILSVIALSSGYEGRNPMAVPKRPGRNGCSTPALLHGSRKRRASAWSKHRHFGEDHAQFRMVPIAIRFNFARTTFEARCHRGHAVPGPRASPPQVSKRNRR